MRSLTSNPGRYIHHDIDIDPSFVSDTTHPEQLPVVCLASLLQNDVAEFVKLSQACRHWGIFQLVWHGVRPELIEGFKVESKEFFELPMEQKRKFWQTPGQIEGFRQTFVASEEQKLNLADRFSVTILPLQHKLPHLLPLLPHPFRETLESYTSELKQLSTKIFYCMAKDSKIDKEDLKRIV